MEDKENFTYKMEDKEKLLTFTRLPIFTYQLILLIIPGVYTFSLTIGFVSHVG